MNVSSGFSESVAQFKEFLAANGYPPSVVWVCPQDVLLIGTRQILVRISFPLRNERHAQAEFERGMKKQMGVLFSTLSHMDAATCRYTWVPADEEEAHRHLMPRAVKFSANTGDSRFLGKDVRNRLRWLWLQLKHRKRQECREELFLLYSKTSVLH
ncbi:MAG TPA: hypothetical protein VI488_11175 [Candidatus Angelobacter sp.]